MTAPSPPTVPPCKRCGAPMPPATLDQVHVTCPYCGTVDVAPPPPASAWLAQHHQLVAPSAKLARKMHLLSSTMILVYVLFIAVVIAVGVVKLLLD